MLGLQNENIPKEAHIFKGPPHHKEGNIPERVVMLLIMIGDHIGIKDPLKEGDIKVRMEGHQIEEGTRIEDTLGEGTPIEMGDLLEEEVHLMEMENPLMMEDPLEMEDPLDTLVDEEHQTLKDPWTSKTGNSTDTLGNLEHNHIGEYL